MEDADERLQSLAVSQWPPSVAAAVLGVMVLALTARAVSVKRSTFERCGYIAVVLWLGVVALREPFMHAVLGHVGVNLAVARFMAHSCAVLGGSALIVLGLAWRDTVRVTPVMWWRRVAIAYLPAALCIAVMPAVSAPALWSNQAIEMYPSRVFLYGVVYACVPIVGAAFAGSVAVRAARAEAGMPGSRLVFALAAFVGSASVLDHSLRVWTAWETSHLSEPELSEALMRRSASTDWMLVVPVGVILLSLMPVVVVSVARRLSADPAFATLLRIRPLWEQLVTVVPDIRLNRALVLSRPEEELHRLLIEVEDALMLVTRWMSDEDLAATTVDERLAAVENAIDRKENGEPELRRAVVLPWMSSEDMLLDLADRDAESWERRYNLP